MHICIFSEYRSYCLSLGYVFCLWQWIKGRFKENTQKHFSVWLFYGSSSKWFTSTFELGSHIASGRAQILDIFEPGKLWLVDSTQLRAHQKLNTSKTLLESPKIEHFFQRLDHTILWMWNVLRKDLKNCINFLLLVCKENDFLSPSCTFCFIPSHVTATRLRFLILFYINKWQNRASSYF